MNTLSNIDISEICRVMGLPLKGIYFKDTVPKDPDFGFYIINLQSVSDSRNGTHWTAFYHDNHINLYYDSFGFPPPADLEPILYPYLFNNKDNQHMTSSSCGFYCIAFIKFLNGFKNKLKAYESFLKLFNDDTTKNELILYNILYGPK